MRNIMLAGIAAIIALGTSALGASALGAAPASAMPATTPVASGPLLFIQPVQYRYDGRYPACPYRYHWECWFDAYGRQSCGCHPEPGLYTGW